MVWILGRTQVNSAMDGKEVVYKIQDGYTLTPLSKWGSKYQPAKGVVDSSISRNPSAFVEGMDISTFFTVLNDQTGQEIHPPVADSIILTQNSRH